MVSFPEASSPKLMCLCLFPSTCHMSSPSHLAWFDHTNNILCRVKILKFLVMQFSPFSCYWILVQFTIITSAAWTNFTLSGKSKLTLWTYTLKLFTLQRLSDAVLWYLNNQECQWHELSPAKKVTATTFTEIYRKFIQKNGKIKITCPSLWKRDASEHNKWIIHAFLS